MSYDGYGYQRDPFFIKMMREIERDAACTIRHGETCPHCGRTLVNIYRIGENVWACRRCKLRIENTHYGMHPETHLDVSKPQFSEALENYCKGDIEMTGHLTTMFNIDGVPTGVEITTLAGADADGDRLINPEEDDHE